MPFCGALSFSVTCEERHTILAIFLLFLHHLRVLLVLLPCVHGKCSRRHFCGSHKQQSYRELQQCSAATSASTCTTTTAAATTSATKPTAAATAAAIADKTFCPHKQHPQPTQQPSPPSLNRPLSPHAQHTHFISSQLSVSVHIWAHPRIQFGTRAGAGIEQGWHDGDQQCQPNGWVRPGWAPHSFKHNGRAYFRLHTCPLRSGSSIRRLGSEQHHPVQHFSGEQHFHPHLWLQWSHHQRGGDRSRFVRFQPGPQLFEWEYSGSGSWAKCSPRCLSGAPEFCQCYPWSSWNDGRQWRECRRGWRSRGERCSCSTTQWTEAKRKHKYVNLSWLAICDCV